MQRFVTFFAALLVAILLHSQAQAATVTLIKTNATDIASSFPGFNTALKAQNLEDEFNTDVFGPLGMELEFGGPTGGTVAVDDAAFEGPGLTGINGSGFILRFNTPVDQVRLRFGSHKDAGKRDLHAFDFAADYTRGPAPGSQSANGNVTAFPTLGLATDFATGSVPSGGVLDLIVSDPGNISAILGVTFSFLWSLEEIEITADSVSAVPIPAALPLFLSGLGLLGFAGWRRKQTTA